MSKHKIERRFDIDWLRVLAVLMLVPFHTARIFDVWEPFYAKNGQVSETLSYIFVGLVDPWHMPLFFLLAGASTWFALGFRSARQYMQERFKRLIVPLIFGVLVVVAPQSYLGALTYGQFAGSFFQYYARFFQVDATGDLSGYMGGFTPGHLWFVLFLFLIASITLPLLFYLRRERGKRLIGRLADFVLDHPSSLWLFALPLVVAWGLPDIGGKNLIYYLVLFVYGYILMTDVRFEKALARIKASALILGSILLISLLIVWTMGREWPEWAQLIMGILYSGPLTWSLLMAILGFGKKCQSFNHPVLRYASEAAYPFYILHQTVIVLIGYYVVQWHLSILLKFLIINATALIATVSVYEMLIRRVNVSRFLFGLKPRRKPKRFLPHAVKREAGRQ